MTNADPLDYNNNYTLNAQSLGLGGVTSRSMTFETHSPENLTMPYLMPSDGEVVGVGQPIAIRFDENIPNRLAAEQSINVVTNPPVEGAFLASNREVRWRPQAYWRPGTTVDVSVSTYGVDLGDGLFGQENVATCFTIGDEIIATANDDTKTLTIRRNGEVTKTMPISMGIEQYDRRQRHLHRRRPPGAHGDGILYLRRSVELSQRLSHRGRLGHTDVLQRHLRARRAVVGRQPGRQQRQPRLPQRQHQQRGVVLREHQPR